MEIINGPEKNSDQTAESAQAGTILSLNELITEIDSETGTLSVYDLDGAELTPNSSTRHSTLQDQFVIFDLEKTSFALPLSSARETGRRPDITPLPNLPGWVLGISNIRGEIISFISLKAFLGIPSTSTKMERSFLIVHNQEVKVGIVVDKVAGILSLDQIDTDLQKSPYREGEISNYIIGVAVSGKSLTNILAIDKLLSSPRMTGFKGN